MNKVDIGTATDADLDGILELQAANQPERGGMLTANLSRSQIAEMMHDSPLIVARRNSRVIGFLMSSTRAVNGTIPIIRALFATYAGTPDAYVYGPICVTAPERGKGLAQAMATELRRLIPNREGILFIRRDNLVSLRAHAKMGMREVASFGFEGKDFVVFSYGG